MRTIIVRVFVPAPGTPTVGLRGIVEAPSDGTADRFEGSDELIRAIERAVGLAGRSTSTG